MNVNKIVGALIELREDCYNQNLVIAEEEPEFYAAIQLLIVRLDSLKAMADLD